MIRRRGSVEKWLGEFEMVEGEGWRRILCGGAERVCGGAEEECGMSEDIVRKGGGGMGTGGGAVRKSGGAVRKRRGYCVEGWRGGAEARRGLTDKAEK